MTTMTCTYPGCPSTAELFGDGVISDGPWLVDASGEWCPRHHPDQLPLDQLTQED